MIVGVPKEIKTHEYRVAMIPVGVEELTRAGHKVLDPGRGRPGQRHQRRAVRQPTGPRSSPTPADVWQRADLIVKVKEPLPRRVAAACGRARSSSPTSTSPPTRTLTRAVMQSGITAIAYETIKDARGTLPLLTPMSEVAGRMSIQEGAKYLERPFEGRGILLGGVPGVLPANVVILGGGVVGANAAKVAAGLGANVTILDINLDRLRYLDDVMPHNVTTLYSDRHNILDSLSRADLLIGAVLIPGARAPHLVRREDLKRMPPRAVIIDVAIDQGGCVETSRPTTHSQPTYIVDDVVHYCVTNMPGAVGRTSTYALTNVTLPYVLQLARKGLDRAVKREPGAGAGGQHPRRQGDEPGRGGDVSICRVRQWRLTRGSQNRARHQPRRILRTRLEHGRTRRAARRLRMPVLTAPPITTPRSRRSAASNSRSASIRPPLLAGVPPSRVVRLPLLLRADPAEFYRTESLRAIIGAEFLRSGNWVVPTLYGEPLLTKPPGMYAAIALVSWPFGGVTEWTARLPSALAATATVFLFYWLLPPAARSARPASSPRSILPASFMWLDKVPCRRDRHAAGRLGDARRSCLPAALEAEEERHGTRRGDKPFSPCPLSPCHLALAGGSLPSCASPAAC